MFSTFRPIQMRKRSGEKYGRLHGFFQGARVKRGKDWEWGNQDGKNNGPFVFIVL